MQDEEEPEFASEVSELERESATATQLFDIRTVIGGLFVVYGLLIGSAGLNASDAAITKAQGVNINLWTGIAMLVFGLLFLLWLKLRPLTSPTHAHDGGAESGSANTDVDDQ